MLVGTRLASCFFRCCANMSGVPPLPLGMQMNCLVSFGRTSFAVILAGSAIGCGGSPTQPIGDGQVRVVGSVRDFQTSTAIGGAHVNVGDTAATTDASGVYSFIVPAGEQRVSIDDESIGIVFMKDRTYRGDFYVHVTGCIARYGTVVDNATRRAVSGATVSVAGVTVTTDQTGWFRLNLGCPGVPCIGFNTTFLSIGHPNYVSGSFVAGRGVCFVERVDYELARR